MLSPYCSAGVRDGGEVSRDTMSTAVCRNRASVVKEGIGILCGKNQLYRHRECEMSSE